MQMVTPIPIRMRSPPRPNPADLELDPAMLERARPSTVDRRRLFGEALPGALGELAERPVRELRQIHCRPAGCGGAIAPAHRDLDLDLDGFAAHRASRELPEIIFDEGGRTRGVVLAAERVGGP